MTKLYNFRCNPELMERAKAQAKIEDRSLTSMIKHLLKEHLSNSKLVGGHHE